MPWYKSPDIDIEPSRYICPKVLSDDTVLGRNISYAKQQRKELGQLRELLLVVQKEVGRSDRDAARYLGQLSADIMKQWRGFDCAIRIVEGDEGCADWRMTKVQEEIAPYVDASFYSIDEQKEGA